MTTEQPRGAGRRLWWIIRTTLLIIIVVALLAAVLGGLGYAGYLGVQEIQRSNNSLVMRLEANEQNLDSLRDLVNTEFAEGNPEQQVQINELENELAAVTSQLEALQTTYAEDVVLQAEQMGALGAALETAVPQVDGLVGELEMVQTALVALQSDLNSNGGRIDELGGDMDRLRLQLSTLDTTLTDLSTETAAAREGEVADVQQSLTLLQLWGLLTNARLDLLDGSEEAAETAVAQAILLSANLTAEPDSPAAEALQRLQTRLDLAADGFVTDLPMVAQDLEAASRELNLLMNGPAPEEETVEATPTTTETVDEDGEEEESGEEDTAVSPTPTAPSETPLPTPTLVPSPTATPTP